MPLISLPSYEAGLATGDPEVIIIGTGESGPQGVEATIEFNGLYMNIRDWIDTYLITGIDGLGDADIRDVREVNPAQDGETYFDAYYGGRTIVLSGKIRAHHIWKLRDMQQALRQAFADISNEKPLIFHAADPGYSLMIYCKKVQSLVMAEAQQNYLWERDFQVSLRASNPRFTRLLPISSSLEVVENLLLNPSAEINSTGYTLVGGTLPRSTAQAHSGAACFLATITGSTFQMYKSGIPVDPGEPYSAGGFVKQGATGPESFTASLGYYNAGGTLIAGSERFGTPIVSSSDWRRAVVEETVAPPGATTMTAVFTFNGVSSGDLQFVDSLMVAKRARLPEYFDGDSDGGRWTGTPHNSSSVRWVGTLGGGAAEDVVNLGSYFAQPIVTLANHMDAPVILNEATGRELKFTGSIDADETVTVDFVNRRMTNQNGISVFDRVAPDSDWPELAPGINPISVSADDFDSDALITLAYRHSYM